jgi:hypothetical protein
MGPESQEHAELLNLPSVKGLKEKAGFNFT